MSSARRQQLLDRLEKKQAQLELLYTAFDNTIGEIEQYSTDTMEGKQTTKYRALDDLQNAIDRLEREVDSIVRRLNGRGITNLNLRRKARPYRGF
jgi:hypothetical protein